METAIRCGRVVVISPFQIFHPTTAPPNVAGDRYSSRRPWISRGTVMMMPFVGAGKGGGVLDRPIIEKTTPGRESEFDLRCGRTLKSSSIEPASGGC